MVKTVTFSDDVTIFYYEQEDVVNYYMIDAARFKDRCLKFEKLFINTYNKNGNKR